MKQLIIWNVVIGVVSLFAIWGLFAIDAFLEDMVNPDNDPHEYGGNL